MDNERRAGIRTTLALLALLGIKCGTLPQAPVEQTPEPTPLVELTPNPDEPTVALYTDQKRDLLVWDILESTNYQRLLNNKNNPTPYSMKVNQQTLTLRINREGFNLKSEFNSQKPPAYLLNRDDTFLMNLTAIQVNTMIKDLRPGYALSPISGNTSINSIVAAKEISSSDDQFTYINFNRGYLKPGEVWMVMLSSHIFNDPGEGLDYTLPASVRITPNSPNQAKFDPKNTF